MPATADLDREAVAALFERIAKDTARAGCASQVAVARHDEMGAFRSFGQARHGDGRVRAADERSLFAIFSVTKAIVSAAAWLLLQEGSLRLSDRVADRIPGFAANDKGAVRVEHLLTHSAGFPHARFPTADWSDPEQRIARFAGWTLDWEPGSRFVYHGTSSMWVLAELITRAAGMDYRDVIRSRITGPLGLRDLFVGLPADENGRVADVVPVGDPARAAEPGAAPVDAPVLDEAMLAEANRAALRRIGSPGGGGIATAADVARFMQALLADAAGRGAGIWDAAMLRDAWSIRDASRIDPMTGQPALRGLGVVIAGEEGRMWRGFAETCSARSFGHMGAGGQICWADPDTGLSFCFLTNGAERDPVRQGARGFRLSGLAAACAETSAATA